MTEPAIFRQKLLIVAVPALMAERAPWHTMESKFTERNVFPDRDVKWLYFGHGINLLSRIGLATFSRRLEANVGEEYAASGPYDEIIFTGHSLGALIARQAWLNAVDANQGRDYTHADWGKKVTRFILFAGISRGLNTERSLLTKLSSRLVEALPGRFTIEDSYRGSAFITNLRISWIRYLASLPLSDRPITEQLLGTEDGLVTGEDSIDLDVLPDVQPIYIAGAGHGDVHDLRGPETEGRLRRVIEAFTEVPARDPTALADAYHDRRVLLIVHGIRASRTDDWVKRAEHLAQKSWPDVIAVSPSYGYLSALRFALPTVRRRYARFFRDFYTEQVARVRRAQVSVLCHSNGTYSLGKCLQDFSAISVDRVCLAGSVLPTRYDWTNLVKTHRVTAIRSDCGSFDVPVAILCKALRSVGMRDVGTAGFDSFFGGVVKEVRFHKGGHGSMFSDRNLESMLQFLLNRNDADPPVDLTNNVATMRFLSRATLFIAPAIVIAIALLFFGGAQLYGWPFIVIVVAVFAFIAIVLDVI